MTLPMPCGPWWSLICNVEEFPDAEKCLMCQHDIPHSAAEHAEVVAHGLKGHGSQGSRCNWHDPKSRAAYTAVMAAKARARAARTARRLKVLQ